MKFPADIKGCIKDSRTACLCSGRAGTSPASSRSGNAPKPKSAGRRSKARTRSSATNRRRAETASQVAAKGPSDPCWRLAPTTAGATGLDAAQWSVSDPKSGQRRAAKQMQERRLGRSRSALRGVAFRLNGDLKLMLDQRVTLTLRQSTPIKTIQCRLRTLNRVVLITAPATIDSRTKRTTQELGNAGREVGVLLCDEACISRDVAHRFSAAATPASPHRGR